MKKHVLISLLSDQTLPNVLFIEAVKQRVDNYVFLETTKTRQKKILPIIINACGLDKDRCKSILVNPEQYEEILHTLKAQHWSNEQLYLLNLTGGTKMMALAAKVFFETMPLHEVYYIPIGTSVAYSLTVSEKTIALPEINLADYLSAHGFSIHGSQQPMYSPSLSANIFKEVMAVGHPGKVPAIRHRILSKEEGKERSWYAGEWFEEWLFFKFRELFNLKNDQILMKAKIKHIYSKSEEDSDGEFDVLFVKHNKLYIVEAKVYTADKLVAKHYTEPIYKIASQQSTLGLHAQSNVVILASLWNDRRRAKRIKDMMQLLRVNKVWDITDMHQYRECFKTILSPS